MVLKDINRNCNNLANVSCRCLIAPLILLAILYGYLRSVFRKKDFTAYTLSLLSALKYTHYIPEIFSHKIRGTITLQIVGSLIHGVVPHVAVQKALSGYDLNNIINFTNIYKT